MTSDEERERRIAAVRLSFAAVCEVHRQHSRTDVLLILSTVLALVAMSFMTAGAWYQGLVLGLAYSLGVFAGGVLWMHAVRKRQFARMKSMYQDVELANLLMEEEEENGS